MPGSIAVQTLLKKRLKKKGVPAREACSKADDFLKRLVKDGVALFEGDDTATPLKL